MPLTIVGSYRPASASTARTSVSLTTANIVTCAVYARFIATSVASSLFGPGGGRIWSLSNNPSSNDQMGLFRSFTGPGLLEDDLNGPGFAGSTGDDNPSASAGDLIETFTQLDVTAKTVNLQVSKNGGTPVAATPYSFAGFTPSGTWGAGVGTPVLFINQIAGAGFGDQSILAVCYASGTPTLQDFRDWFGPIDDDAGWFPPAWQQDIAVSVW